MISSGGEEGVEGSLEIKTFGENEVGSVVRSLGESANLIKGRLDVTELLLEHSIGEAEPGLAPEGCAVVGSFHLGDVPMEV